MATEKRLIYRDPEQAALLVAPHTAYVERTNLSSRQMTGRLVRKTLGFSKRLALLRAACAWEDLVYNWTRPVKTLRFPSPTARAVGSHPHRRWPLAWRISCGPLKSYFGVSPYPPTDCWETARNRECS